MKTLNDIKAMVTEWLANPEANLDRLAQLYGEELTALERAGADDMEAQDLYEKFDKAIKAQYAEGA